MSTGRKRITLAVAVLAGLAACGHGAPAAAPATTVAVDLDRSRAMPHMVQMPEGTAVKFVNRSGAVHILVLGSDSTRRPQPGAPSFGATAGRRLERAGTWTTALWQHPGTYTVACTVHPGLNLTVVVTGPAGQSPAPPTAASARPAAPAQSASSNGKEGLS